MLPVGKAAGYHGFHFISPSADGETLRGLLELDDGYAALAFSVDAETERFDVFAAAKLVVDRGAKNARALAVDDTRGRKISHVGAV